jgi:hypothetical protein
LVAEKHLAAERYFGGQLFPQLPNFLQLNLASSFGFKKSLFGRWKLVSNGFFA